MRPAPVKENYSDNYWCCHSANCYWELGPLLVTGDSLSNMTQCLASMLLTILFVSQICILLSSIQIIYTSSIDPHYKSVSGPSQQYKFHCTDEKFEAERGKNHCDRQNDFLLWHQVLSPKTCEYYLIWQKGFCRCDKGYRFWTGKILLDFPGESNLVLWAL